MAENKTSNKQEEAQQEKIKVVPPEDKKPVKGKPKKVEKIGNKITIETY